MHAGYRMFALFAADETVDEQLLTTQINSRSMESDFANTDTRTLENTRTNTNSVFKSKTKPQSGGVKSFDNNNNNRMTLSLTTKIREKMKGCTVLEDNEVEIMISFYKTYTQLQTSRVAQGRNA